MRARSFVAVVAFLAVAAVLSPARAFAQEAIVSQDGWWNRLQGPQPNEPPNPGRQLAGPLLPAPSTVPGNAIAVGAQGGEPDKVAAIGIILDAPEGAIADRLILTLKESPANGANVNAGNAKIIACPITSFWAGAKNGNWADRPTCDDSQAVPGQRNPNGAWTFDLTLLAMQWLDPTSDLPQNGVLLAEAVDAPQSFQISFLDAASGGIATDFAATGGGFSGSGDFELTDDTFTTGDGGFAGDTSFDAGDGAGFADVGVPAATSRGATGGRTPGRAVGAPALRAQPAGDTKLFGNISPATFLLAPLTLAGVGLLSYLLGPAGQPSATRRRQGGVSRALARRRASRPS